MSDEQGETTVAVEPEVVQETRTRRLPPYNVVILNDEEHTFEYVIELLIKLFAHSIPTAEKLTLEIHHRGRADRLHDPQGKGRAEARAGPLLRRRPPHGGLQGPPPLLHRAGLRLRS